MSLSEGPGLAPRWTGPSFLERGDPARRPLEQFIEARFACAYGATVESHYPLLCGLGTPDGQVAAAAGLRFAPSESLFLERYLDQPVEQAVAGALGRPLARDEIVEIGSLAATGPAPALELFAHIARRLEGAGGPKIAVATVRPELVRLLARSGFDLRPVAPADPSRLGPEAQMWGSYYAGRPQIYAGEIRASAELPALSGRLCGRLATRHERRLTRAAS